MSFFRSRTAKPMVPDPIPVDKPTKRAHSPTTSNTQQHRTSSSIPPPPRTSQYQPPPGPPPPPASTSASSSVPPPPPRSTLSPQQQRLTSLARLAAQLDNLTRNFSFPNSLHFDSSASPSHPKLTFDATNKPVLELDDGLTKLLLALDGVESDGDPVVRDERRRLVKAVEAEIEKLDKARREAYERQRENGTLGGTGGAGPAVEGEDGLGALGNGGTPARGPGGGVPPPPRAQEGTEPRIYQHRGPDNHWNDSPPVILRRAPGADGTEQPTGVRNKRASMRRPPPTNFF